MVFLCYFVCSIFWFDFRRIFGCLIIKLLVKIGIMPLCGDDSYTSRGTSVFRLRSVILKLVKNVLYLFMKKQHYAARKFNISTSDDKAKMNYLQHVGVKKSRNHFDRSNRLSPFRTYMTPAKSHTKR